MSSLVAIAGPIASGKSTLARALADRWSCPRAAFGALVAHEAQARAWPTDRDALQTLGAALIDELGWPEFCRRTFEHVGAGWNTSPLVVDGVRHRAAVETLGEQHVAGSALLVYVTCDAAERERRQLERGASVEDVRRWDLGPTENELGVLERLAGVIVAGDRPPGDAIARIEAALDGRRR